MTTLIEPKPEAQVPPKTRSSGRGQKPMIWLPGVVLVGLAIYNDYRVEEKHGALWPLFVAIFAFLYLWWLSSLLFDLLFVWHCYIQGDAAHRFLRQEVRRADLSTGGDLPPHEPLGGPAALPPKGPRGGASFIFEEESHKAVAEESLGA